MPTAAVHNATATEITPETPCVHCGLPVGRYPVGDGPYFCCTGCRMVYQALQTAGFDETFYRLRDLAPAHSAVAPVPPPADDLKLFELDTDAFLQEHTRPVKDGVRSVELFLDGVHCAACVWLVERLPYEVDGVLEARLDLPRARLTVHFDPERAKLAEVARWLAQFGYVAHPSRQQGMTRRTQTERRLLIKLGICWALAGNVMLFAFALYAGLDTTNDASLATAARWASLALATVAIVYGGSEFFRRSWASLKLAARTRQFRSLHIDTPISLGLLAGFGHSAWATISGRGDVWFDSITVLIAALLTARWLQLRSRRLAGDATERLLSLLPSMARRVRTANDELRMSNGTAPTEANHSTLDTQHSTVEIIRLEDVKPGDLIEVPAGEVFPIDGVIESGTSTVNKAVLTGESRPEPAEPGTTVEAGATNLSAPLQVRVQAAGAETRVGKLLAWIRSQETKQAPVVLLADRLSGFFVLGVLLLATITAAVWLSLAPSEAVPHVVALLVISCPCALGMATPLAMAVAAGRAARAGIFIKSDEATQQLTAIDTVVLDKTGTLTEGRMTLLDYDGDDDALDLATALETHSNHPIATALVQSRGTCTLDGETVDLPPVEAFEAIAGQGLRGWVAHHDVAVGRPAWIAELTGPLPAAFDARLAGYAAQGHTPVAVAVDGRCAAVLAFGDRLRETSKAVIDALQAADKDVYLLSGDHDDVVQRVAETLGIPSGQAFGNVSPEQKRAFVSQLRRMRHRTVAMVGDGVNDAAALQAADVGVAVQGGSTPSLVAADVFLTREGLTPVATLLAGTRHVMRVVRRNLGFSLAYNVVGAGAALLGLVTPLAAAVAMPLSSLVVVLSSIIQRPFAPDASVNQIPPRAL